MVRVHLAATDPELTPPAAAGRGRLQLRRAIPVLAAATAGLEERSELTMAAGKFRPGRQSLIRAQAATAARPTARAGRNSCASGLRWKWAWVFAVLTEASKARSNTPESIPEDGRGEAPRR